jgi:hypothetical protein
MVMLIQALAALFLLLGSALIVRALVEIDREPRSARRAPRRDAEPEGRFRRAA